MRKLVCWACGKEILKGKFLHCTACGVNFGDDCWQTLGASLVDKGAPAPPAEQSRERNIPSGAFLAWMCLGKMAGREKFAQDLLNLLSQYPQRRPNGVPQVLFQCSNCLVDVDYRVADAGLFQLLSAAIKSQKDEIWLEGVEIDKYQEVDLVGLLSFADRKKYCSLVRSGLADQLEIINMVQGAQWKVLDFDPNLNHWEFGQNSSRVRIKNEPI